MRINLVGAFTRNFPFGSEIAFAKGLTRIGGHRVTTVDPSLPGQELDHRADVTLVFVDAGKYNDELTKTDGVKVVYQPDDSRFPHVAQSMEHMRKYCDYALTFDQYGAMFAEDIGYRLSRRLLLTADDELYVRKPLVSKQIDLCFVGNISHGEHHVSRMKMVDLLEQAGFRVAVLNGMYDTRRIVEIYNGSKIVLNHATDVGQSFGKGYGYQARHFEAGMTGACVLSNDVIDEPDEPVSGFVKFWDEESLLEMAYQLLRSENMRRERADELFMNISRNHRPEHRARELVEFFEKCVACG